MKFQDLYKYVCFSVLKGEFYGNLWRNILSFFFQWNIDVSIFVESQGLLSCKNAWLPRFFFVDSNSPCKDALLRFCTPALSGDYGGRCISFVRPIKTPLQTNRFDYWLILEQQKSRRYNDFFQCKGNTYGSRLAIRFKDWSLLGLSFTNMRDIVSSKAIDISEWLNVPDDFFNARNRKSNASFW